MMHDIEKPERAPKLRRAGKIAIVSVVFTVFGTLFLGIISIFIRKRKRKD